MSSDWDAYPSGYRASEIRTILSAVLAGECVSLVGLSGAGKSNLLGFLANREDAVAGYFKPDGCPRFVLVDCNWLVELSSVGLLRLICHSLGEDEPQENENQALYTAIRKQLAGPDANLCLLFDRFDRLTPGREDGEDPDYFILMDTLRALRDAYKYRLTYVIATRGLLDPRTELAELFYANTIWLGPLNEDDARWNVTRYARRKGMDWDDTTVRQLIQASWGYPSLLRAACEAYAGGASLEPGELVKQPAIRRRMDEFWADEPDDEAIRLSGLEGHPLLIAGRPGKPTEKGFDTSQLTAKEYLLLDYFRRHPEAVCEKDDLIRAVWPEDKIYERGIRDDSLAQLIRRLREKIEADPSTPRYIHTVPGRGYRFKG